MAIVMSTAVAQHNAGHNGKVLMIASNKSESKQTGWPIGVWYSELTHPYWAFTEAGYTVDIASLEGGELFFDSFSDPEDVSKYAAFDFISLGFKKDPAKMALAKNTLKLSGVNPADYKAIFVCGGQGPMYTFYKNPEIEKFFVDFYLTGKPTAAICHGTAILLNAKLPNGKLLVDGKKWTGFASEEEQYADAYVGRQIQPFRIEDLARQLPNSKYEDGPAFSPFAVRDGNLITGQQQNSGALAAVKVLEALNEDKKRYPTYVLVHGAIVDKFLNGQKLDIFEFNEDYTLIGVKKEAIPQVVCADCPEFMKEALIKYHRPDPVMGFNDVVKLGPNFAKVSKFYIATTNDNAVPFALQQQMVKENGTVRKVYQMETSHLPFVVQPDKFLAILGEIK